MKNYGKKLKYFLLPTVMVCVLGAGEMYAVNAFAANDQSNTVSAAISDSVITTKVKAQLAANDITKAASISVTTNNGIVTLKGTVPSNTEALEAIQTAALTTGVKSVKSDKLFVKGSSQPLTDSYITAKVKGTFIREKLFSDIPAMSIKVETKNGVVYLSGEVDNQDQIDTAIRLTNTISGVKKVDSSITIK